MIYSVDDVKRLLDRVLEDAERAINNYCSCPDPQFDSPHSSMCRCDKIYSELELKVIALKESL